LIYDEAATLIEEHHLAGRDVVIVSTSGPRSSNRSVSCWAPTT
jgi:phosphoserine phosphatase